jgi:hypothetical protein
VEERRRGAWWLQAVAALRPASKVEYVFAVAEVSSVLGEVEPEEVVQRLADYGLRTLLQLGVDRGERVFEEFERCVEAAVKALFGVEPPPFRPPTRAYREELLAYLAANERALPLDRVLRLAQTRLERDRLLQRLADRILLAALLAFFHREGLMRWRAGEAP